MNTEKNTVRIHMKIYGQVQGVGFRYRAKHAAEALRITGWVKNDWDGTVLLEAQGEMECINEMLTLVSKGTFIRIEKIVKTNMELDEQERGFHVR